MSQAGRYDVFFRRAEPSQISPVDFCYISLSRTALPCHPRRLEVVSVEHVAALCKNQGSGGEEGRECGYQRGN